MEETTQSNKASPSAGSRQLNLKKSFTLGIRSLLTACSKEDFCKAFPHFTVAEQERLHRLFIEVITSLHESIEDAFESLCLETQVGSVLDLVEQHVEEQNLDPLFAEKSNIGTIAKTVCDAKKDEILHLTSILQKAEEQKHLMSTRLHLLREQRQNFSGVAAVVDKLRMDIERYGTGSTTGL
ncbi:OLC1v1030806C1 [Oldenlandia corymbosa var. corymbosa]|uniref:OLC1v1030806C1 n=1 Tax=Oldenlandia corymbosa var. corymbosa TaxID=529605 RepID=A0AAV1CJV0_OLDCO|nr:OLC1v1030806C1 [Oldenlandia corymbosa var. corymbosa]